MSVSGLTIAMLLAGAPVNPGDAPPAAPVPLTAPPVSEPEVPVPPVASDAPASPETPSIPEPSAAPSEPGQEQNEIVVKAQRRSTPGDPLESINATSYAVTQSVDKAIVAPAAKAYSKILPRPFRSGLRNFFNNLGEPVVFLNYLLQLKPGKAAETAGRFAINSTIGAAGLFDVAKKRPFKLPRRPNGFANTMGYYGVKPGAFLYLPLIGPTTVRDALGLGLDRLVLPLTIGKPFDQPAYTIPAGLIGSLDARVEFDAQLRKMHEADDPYAASRTNYLQSRQAEIDALHGRKAEAPRPAPRSGPNLDPAAMPDAAQPEPTATTPPPEPTPQPDMATPP